MNFSEIITLETFESARAYINLDSDIRKTGIKILRHIRGNISRWKNRIKARIEYPRNLSRTIVNKYDGNHETCYYVVACTMYYTLNHNERIVTFNIHEKFKVEPPLRIHYAITILIDKKNNNSGVDHMYKCDELRRKCYEKCYHFNVMVIKFRSSIVKISVPFPSYIFRQCRWRCANITMLFGGVRITVPFIHGVRSIHYLRFWDWAGAGNVVICLAPDFVQVWYGESFFFILFFSRVFCHDVLKSLCRIRASDSCEHEW